MQTTSRRLILWEPLFSALLAFLLALLMFAMNALGAPAPAKPPPDTGGLLEKFLDGPMLGVESVVFAAAIPAGLAERLNCRAASSGKASWNRVPP